MKIFNIWIMILTVIAVQLLSLVWYSVFSQVWSSGWGVIEGELAGINFAMGAVLSIFASFTVTLGYTYLALRMGLKTKTQYMLLGLLFVGLFLIPGMLVNMVFLGVPPATQLVDTVFILLQYMIVSVITALYYTRPGPRKI